MVAARLKEADATAVAKMGEAEARSVELRMLAEARGKEADAGALERRLLAEAKGTEEQGRADALAVRERLTAEAAGLAEKATAMKAMEGRAWEHEEFRIRLEQERTIKLEALKTQRGVAEAQATIMAAAFGNAELRIIGGDGEFFDRFVRAASMGASVDALLDNSSSLTTALGGYLNGERQLPDDIKDMIAGLGGASGQLRDMSAAALMGRLMSSADDETRTKLTALLQQASQASPNSKG